MPKSHKRTFIHFGLEYNEATDFHMIVTRVYAVQRAGLFLACWSQLA